MDNQTRKACPKPCMMTSLAKHHCREGSGESEEHLWPHYQLLCMKQNTLFVGKNDTKQKLTINFSFQF